MISHLLPLFPRYVVAFSMPDEETVSLDSMLPVSSAEAADGENDSAEDGDDDDGQEEGDRGELPLTSLTHTHTQFSSVGTVL